MSDDTEPALHTIDVGEIDMAYVEWRPELRGRGPTLLMVHATGFHSRLWDEIAIRLPNYHIIALDQRGHGRSTGGPVTHWRQFIQHVCDAIEALNLENVVGVGHSMGAHVLIAAAGALTGRFRRLLLIDPVVAAPEAYEGGGDLPYLKDGELHPASKRKNHFASPEAMIERFQDRAPYSLFTPEMLRNYCTHGLAPAGEGDGYVLACAPEMEASVYMTARSNGAIYDSVKAVDIPVLIVRAKQAERDGGIDFAASPTWPGLAAEFPNGREIYRPDRTHFILMEAPDEIASLIEQEAEQENQHAA